MKNIFFKEKREGFLKKHGRIKLMIDKLASVMGGADYYRKGGEYYINSPELGGEMKLHDYGILLEEVCGSRGMDSAVRYARGIDPRPQTEELLRAAGPWGIVDYWQRRLDGCGA